MPTPEMVCVGLRFVSTMSTPHLAAPGATPHSDLGRCMVMRRVALRYEAERGVAEDVSPAERPPIPK